MVRHSLKQLIANKARLSLTAFAIVISVAFVVASFIMSDGVGKSLTGIVGTQTENIDLAVSPQSAFETGLFESDPRPVDDATLDAVRSVPGVEAALPTFLLPDEFSFRPPGVDGQPLDNETYVEVQGWVEGGHLNVTKGQAPSGVDEFVVDTKTAEKNSYTVGKYYSVATPFGQREMLLSGLVRVGDENLTAGAAILGVEMDALQELLDNPGYNSLSITAVDGTNVADLQQDIDEVLPQGIGVKTKAQVEEELQTELSQITNIFQGTLLGFAFIAVFVSGFIIYNTFSILVTQRTKEIGLLRAIGANPKQIRRSIQAEALLLGLLASAAGIGVGIWLNYGLTALLNSFDAELPKSDLVLAPRTIMVGFAVGTVITLLSALIPARRACRVPAIVALTSGTIDSPESSKKRLVAGTLLAVFGTAILLVGLTGYGTARTTVLALGLGAMSLFIAVATINPFLVVPLTNGLGWPLRSLLGIPGKVASENMARNPGRSASTAAALMVGLALVSTVLTVGQSVKSAQSGGLEKLFDSEYVVGDLSGTQYPIDIADKLEDLDVVERATSLASDNAEVDGKVQSISVAQQQDAGGVIDFGITDGVASSATVIDPVIVSKLHADENGIKVGDIAPITFINGEKRNLTVIGLYENYSADLHKYVIDRQTWTESTDQASVSFIALQPKDGVSKTDFLAAVDQFRKDFPQVEVRTLDSYVEENEAAISELLTVINLMILLAIVISFMGIASTLALSIFERGREIGLLRAVGMHRRQLRRMIRYEAVLVSMFGAMMGVSLGIAFSVVSVLALPTWLVSSLTLPVPQILALLAFSIVAAVIAAALPAFRASRSKPLDLIGG